MLVELKCSSFKRGNGEIREKIKFHKGLNVLQGGTQADNSIGKSTFLLILDFVYGGKKFLSSVAVKKIPDQEICFCFKFDKLYYFKRNTIDGALFVYKCNEKYENEDKINLSEYIDFLSTKYLIQKYDGFSFRSLQSNFMRIAGKDNTNIKDPLYNGYQENFKKKISRLEKIFDEYSKISNVKEQLIELNKKKKIHKQFKESGYFPSAITTKKEYQKKIKELENLDIEINAFTENNIDIDKLDVEKNEKIIEIKQSLKNLRWKKTSLNNHLEKTKTNLSNIHPYEAKNTEEIHKYFPSINLKRIDDVERFHGKLVNLLHDEVNDEIIKLNKQIAEIDNEISELELKLEGSKENLNITKTVLDKYLALNNQKKLIEESVKYYRDKTDYDAQIKTLKSSLKSIENNILISIRDELNQQMVRFNDSVVNLSRKAPVLDIDENSYRFYTPDDDGTGTSYKGIIIFDLSILKLTKVPVLIHDSIMFKNIEDFSLEGILKLYSNFDKQIFIAFDKSKSYSDKVRKILEDNTVLSICSGDELYGIKWDLKDE